MVICLRLLSKIHTKSNRLYSKNIQIGDRRGRGVEDMEFLRALKKEHVKIPWLLRKEVEFAGVFTKNSNEMGWALIKKMFRLHHLSACP